MTEYAIGFDTSNYTTSCAVFDGAAGKNSGRMLETPEGALGLRQSEALFAHVKWLPEVFAGLHLDGKAVAVGASVTPREAEGSYMPCFLAGASQGEVLAKGLGVPFYGFSHQQGHVAAAAWSSRRADSAAGGPDAQAGGISMLDAPMLCWHLSGGTTELLLVKPESAWVTCEILGGTGDVSAGQLIDRTGQLLGLKFPSGAALDALAVIPGNGAHYVPKADGLTFSLSGVEHKVKAMVSDGKSPEEIAYFAFWSVTSAIEAATMIALEKYPGLPVLFSGGVASSRFVRRALPYGVYAQPQYSADNAMGAAILAYRAARAA